jgi:hypothetical protein
MATFIDLTGRRFGRLEVVGRAPNRNTVVYWLCRCDCGIEKEVGSQSLRSGRIKSCGCLRVDTSRARCTTHGKCNSREYQSWQNMKRRCSDISNEAYANYGARGITYHESFEQFDGFFEYLGVCPEGYSLDRIDNDGNYEPGNVRWASRSTQNANQRKRNGTESKFRGVSKTPHGWKASITFDQHSHHIGYYLIEEEAALAFDDYVLTNSFDRKLNFTETEGESYIEQSNRI